MMKSSKITLKKNSVLPDVVSLCASAVESIENLYDAYHHVSLTFSHSKAKIQYSRMGRHEMSECYVFEPLSKNQSAHQQMFIHHAKMDMGKNTSLLAGAFFDSAHWIGKIAIHVYGQKNIGKVRSVFGLYVNRHFIFESLDREEFCKIVDIFFNMPNLSRKVKDLMNSLMGNTKILMMHQAPCFIGS